MDKTKLRSIKNRTLFIIFIIILIIGGLRTFDDLKRNNEILSKQNDRINSYINTIYQSEINKLEEVIELQGQILSNSTFVKQMITKRDRTSLYNYTKIYFDSIKSTYPNINIMHYHLSDHTSFLRMHKKEKHSDNLKDIRPMITQAINEKISTTGYEHGKKDINMLTYRMSFPIFNKDKLLGILEIGIDTNYIGPKIEKALFNMYEKNTYIFPIIKKYTKNFDLYDDYGGSFKNYIYKKDIKFDSILNKSILLSEEHTLKIKDKSYYLEWNKINLNNSHNEIIGSYLYIVDITKNIIENKKFFYSSLSKPIIALIILLLLISWIFEYFYKQFLDMEKRTRHILDTQSSLIVLTNGKSFIDCNSALFKFLGFNSFEELKNNRTCISDSFVENIGFIEKYMKEKTWLDYILENSDIPHKVGIKNTSGEIHIFNITLNIYSKNDSSEFYYLATMTDISDLEKVNNQLIEQSKQASLGEMIANIAHQWRQPLSTITAIASGVEVRYKLDLYDMNDITTDMDTIVGKSKYLSETIETFRNFLQEGKEKTEVIVQERINISLAIVEASIKDNHIQIINDIDYKDNIIIEVIASELSQVIINILNNAKDALIENKIDKPIIRLSLNKTKKFITIMIEDNAGGIALDILPKIFDPYFTTKHKSQGTGLGLHMSYRIVNESLNGNIFVKNTDKGAKFYIDLPLDKKE